MNLKETATHKLVDFLNCSRIAGEISFYEGTITCWKKVVYKEDFLNELKRWKEQRTKDYQNYKKKTSPFEEVTAYASYTGVCGAFSQHTLAKKNQQIIEIANERLLPFICYPYNTRGAIHCFSSGEGVVYYSLVEEIDKICEYWIELIDEVYSRLKGEDFLKYNLKRNPFYFQQNKALEWEMRVAGNCFKEKTSLKNNSVESVMFLLKNFTETVEVIDERTPFTIKEGQYGGRTCQIALINEGEIVEIKTKNGFDSYKGVPLYCKKSEGGSSYDTYYVSFNPKFRVTFK